MHPSWVVMGGSEDLVASEQGWGSSTSMLGLGGWLRAELWGSHGAAVGQLWGREDLQVLS